MQSLNTNLLQQEAVTKFFSGKNAILIITMNPEVSPPLKSK